MSQEVKVIARVDTNQASADIRRLESSFEEIRSGFSRSKLVINTDGFENILSITREISNGMGTVITETRQLNRETGEISVAAYRVVENYEQLERVIQRNEKEAEKLSNQMLKQQQMRERENAKAEAAAARSLASQKEEYQLANRLLETEQRLAAEAERRAKAEGEAAQRRYAQQTHASRLSDLEHAFSYAGLEEYNQRNAPFVSGTNGIYTDTVPIQQYIDTLTGVNREQSKINETTSMFATISESSYKKYAAQNGLAREAQEGFGEATRKAEERMRKAQEQAEKSSRSYNFLSTVLYRLGHTVITQVTKGFREALQEMKAVDSELVVVRKVTGASAEELEALRDRAYEVGKAYGVVASDYLSAAAEFSRAGYKDQAGDLAELATKLQLVGDVSQDVANQFLIATDKAYGLNGNYEKLSQVIDELNEIDNNFATSIEKVAQGLGTVAPVAAQAHVSVEELSAAIGTITATTQRSGSEAARALRAIFLNVIGDTQTEVEEGETVTKEQIDSLKDALQQYAPEVVKAAEATGTLINPMTAIASLADAYERGLISEQKLMAMVTDIGGKLRSSQLMALIQNWEMYEEMLEKTATAAGSADREVQNALDSWEVKLNILKNTWTDFVQETLSTGFIKGALDGLTWLIESFGNLGTVIAIVTPALIAFRAQDIVSFAQKGQAALWNFAAAFTGTGDAATVASARLSVAAAIIAGIIIAINAYNKSLEDAIAKGAEARKSLDNLETLYAKYEKLNAEAANTKEAQSARDDLIETLKDEGVWVDSVIGKYETLDEKITAATDAAVAYRKVQLNDALDAAERSFTFSKDAIWTGGYVYNAGRILKGDTNYAANRIGTYVDPQKTAELYDLAIKKRTEFANGIGGSPGSREDNDLRIFIETYDEIVENYRSVLKAIEKTDSAEQNAVSTTDNLSKSTGELSDSTNDAKTSFIGLQDEIEGATKALEAYQKKLEEGEKGDALVSYSEAWKNARELFEKGLTGTNAYKSAIDLLFSPDFIEQMEWNYEELGELLGSSFFSTLFANGGEDFGASAAKYLSENRKEFEKYLSVTDNADGSFNIAINDIEGLARKLNVSTDALWAMVDAWDAFDGSVSVSLEDLRKIIATYGDATTGAIDSMKLINDLVADGKSASEIHAILDGLQKMEGVKLDNLPKNLTDTVDELKEANKEISDDKNANIVITSNADDVFGNIRSEIETLNGSKIYISVVHTDSGAYQNWQNGSSIDTDYSHYIKKYKVGVDSASAGLALVNEDGPELIDKKNGGAYIANGGKMALVKLDAGDTVYTADETKSFISDTGASAAPRGRNGNGAVGSRIDPSWFEKQRKSDDTSKSASSKSSGSGGGGGSSSEAADWLDLLDDYMSDLLKKAKDSLDEQYAVLEETSELEEARLNMLKAEKGLADANAERTVRYYNKATGQWERKADQKAVQSASESLKDAQKSYLETQYKALEDAWKDIQDIIKRAMEGTAELDGAAILAALGASAAGGSLSDVQTLISNIGSFTSNPLGGINTSLLDYTKAASLLYPRSLLDSGLNLNHSLSALYGISTADPNAKGTNLITTMDRSSTTYGATYYINGVKIGSDMMDKPLSQILSVLPIYAN